jgi:chromosome condensin MukBEF ATPase and DNA-binding subunit MukB
VIPEDVFGQEAGMNTPGREAALGQLQARRQQIERELAQVERQIAQTRLQVVTVEQRITRLTRSQRLAA